MKTYDTEAIRNIALCGHGHTGKTSLASALLFSAGAVNRLGSTDKGTTVTDFDEDEIARKFSVSTSLAFCEWKGVKINLIDTPGYLEFIHEAKLGLRVADSALVLVDAVAGVEVQSEKTFRYAEEFDLPVFIVINKIDRERASFSRALQSIADRFGRAAVPLQLPIGSEAGFSGVADLLKLKAYRFADDGSGKMEEGEVPAELQQQVQGQRETLLEMVAESDDTLLEKFLDGGSLSDTELERGLKAAVGARKLFPVFTCSALRNQGSHSLLDALVAWAPSPADIGTVKGLARASQEPVERKISSREPVSFFVWKTTVDPFSGKISLFKVYSGTVKADSSYHSQSKDHTERLGAIAILQGKQMVTVPELRAGDLGAVAKLRDTNTGDTFCDKSAPILYQPVVFKKPSISYALHPKSRGDEDKLSNAMQRLQEEDAMLFFDHDPGTNELLVSGAGSQHIDVVVGRLKRKFGVEVVLSPPKVPYRETIRRKAEAQGRYKRQTGGRGQYGDCWVRLEPLPRGSDFEFAEEIFGGSIPKNYWPAIEKGIQGARLKGYLAGYPVVDFRAVVYDGSYHDVDSSEMAFKIAGSLAFKNCMEKCEPVLLEPIMMVEVTAPDENMGDVLGNLTSRRGRMLGMENVGHDSVIKAQAPMSEMLNYAPDLNSITGGRGSFSMEFDHYAEVPSHIAQKIIDASPKRAETEEK